MFLDLKYKLTKKVKNHFYEQTKKKTKYHATT